METVKMFMNGQAMSGGSINGALHETTFIGETNTAPYYRFYSVRGEFPGLSPVDHEGQAITGELYEIRYEDLRSRLLPLEPPELELHIIQLSDGSGSLSMIMRNEALGAAGDIDITEFGGWLNYRHSKSEAASRPHPHA